MRIAVTADLEPQRRDHLRDRVRLALGSRAQTIRWIELDGDGKRLRLRAELTELDAWHTDTEGALERLVDRLRRTLSRPGSSGLSPAPPAPPR